MEVVLAASTPRPGGLLAARPTGLLAPLLAFASLATGCGFPDYGFGSGGGSGTAGSADAGSGAAPSVGGGEPISTGAATPSASNATGGAACDAVEDCPPLANGEPLCFQGRCVIGACAEGFADCDDVASTGCEAELAASLLHCGGCNQACSNAHGETSCVDGVCTPACDAQWGSCDGNPNDGCETSTTTSTDCGGCDLECLVPNAIATCGDGTCTFTACEPGWGDCNGDLGDGCETDTTITGAHCGGCGDACGGGEICSDARCDTTCAPGTASCDGDVANGCETDTEVDFLHCGGCGNACNDAQLCSDGDCVACGGALRDCDRDGANGCEANTAIDRLSCGGCGLTCGADATCGCAGAACSGGTIHFSEDFSDNTRGWSLAGEWQIGATSASVGHEHGFPDPSADHSATDDQGVLGVALGANYSAQPHDPEHATSPVVDLSGAAGNVTLTFWRHLDTDRDPRTTATVEVWSGAAWETIWSNAESGNSPTTDSTWTRHTHDVTPYKNADFRVRFGHRTRKQGQTLARIMSGWNVDDLSLTSEACL